jgi:hypothetical protein
MPRNLLRGGMDGAVQRSYLLVLWVQVPPLQFSVGNVVIPDSGWSDPMAESSEVNAFYWAASNQKGRSESERNRHRNTYHCSCQVSWPRDDGYYPCWKKLRDAHTKTVPITEEGNGKEVCRLADEVAKLRDQDDDKPGGARTSGFRRDNGNTSSRLRARIWMLTQPKSQSVGQTCALETDSRGSDEVCSGCTGKGSLRADRRLNLKPYCGKTRRTEF